MGYSSPKITLKHHSHMWSGVDELIAEEMKGNINILTVAKTGISFNGNHAIKNKFRQNLRQNKSKVRNSVLTSPAIFEWE